MSNTSLFRHACHELPGLRPKRGVVIARLIARSAGCAWASAALRKLGRVCTRGASSREWGGVEKHRFSSEYLRPCLLRHLLLLFVVASCSEKPVLARGLDFSSSGSESYSLLRRLFISCLCVRFCTANSIRCRKT